VRHGQQVADDHAPVVENGWDNYRLLRQPELVKYRENNSLGPLDHGKPCLPVTPFVLDTTPGEADEEKDKGAGQGCGTDPVESPQFGPKVAGYGCLV
jgi:hypothetical protein